MVQMVLLVEDQPWPLGVWDGGGRWRLNLRSLSFTSNFSQPTAKLLRAQTPDARYR